MWQVSDITSTALTTFVLPACGGHRGHNSRRLDVERDQLIGSVNTALHTHIEDGKIQGETLIVVSTGVEQHS